MRLRHLDYRNPLDVTLTGSGFLIAGVIYVLRMMRDLSSSRRAATAAAGIAEANVEEARARQARTEAGILLWFTDEARAGAGMFRPATCTPQRGPPGPPELGQGHGG